jgi:hypothetical protein
MVAFWKSLESRNFQKAGKKVKWSVFDYFMRGKKEKNDRG